MTDKPAKVYAVPEGIVAAFATLRARERIFVDRVLRGEEPEIAAQSAGYRSRLAAADLLGRPKVSAAIQRAAPFLPPAIAIRALRPLLVASLTATAMRGGAAGISATRDLMALGKASEGAPSAMDAWAQRQAARVLASKDESLDPIGPASAPEIAITALPKDELQ
jgi:hypothetical protein